MYLVWGCEQEGGLVPGRPRETEYHLGSTGLGRRQEDPGVQEALPGGEAGGDYRHPQGWLPPPSQPFCQERLRSVLRDPHAGPAAGL